MPVKTYCLTLLCATAFVAGATGHAAAAESRATTAMECAAARSLVRTHGAIVLYTGPHLYDRYVDHAGFCPRMTRTQAAWVPTRDNPQCFIGYTCEQPNFRSRR